ncbi:c-type cytochrome [Roseisolibacter sp. H3M3-2]|uniref:c-type cytochrome n=1 Tax=Roseisolibacter sp. H3M3-2 TaxID=3031323 RepID=UPI0023DAB29B|nr:c-type cytochrome [Roseisolibacter sp. H3M3-2]MDF1503463.1 c-type cytochrome [Roseisolibacter sp. H3M3-2]
MTARRLLLLALLPLGACTPDRAREETAARLTRGGNPETGKALIRQYGCGSCHVIPGIPGATGGVGPALDRLRQQPYVAGVTLNTPDHLMRWVQDPQAVDSLTAMPDLDVSQRDARHIVAYLYAAGR